MVSYYKPLYILCEKGAESYVQPVMHGIIDVLYIAKAARYIDICNFGVWRHPAYIDPRDGALTQFNSVDWYVAMAQYESRSNRQLNAATLLRLFATEPWQRLQPHFNVMVVKSDLYEGETNFIIGAGQENLGAVISVHRFLNLADTNLQYECIRSETMHEMGHIFGLVPASRTHNVEENLGKHCTNRCIMRQGLSVPDDWIRLTNDRLDSGNPFCPACQNDLLNFIR